MGWFALRRLLSAIPTIFIVITLAFFMMRIAPGGPFDGERALPPEIEANMLAAYGLDQPLWKQYLDYIDGVLHFDFGPSYKKEDFTVNELIAQGAPISIKLGVTALSIALVIGVFLGSVAALNQNSGLDYGIMATAMFGITVPNFVVAPLLSLVLGVWFNLLPTSGWGGTGWGGGDFRHMLLPVIALSLPQVAVISRLARGGMIEVLRSNFVRTARAKGLPEGMVIRRHALRAGILPVVSYLGPATAAVMTGSVVIEKIFALPGLGRYFVEGALQRDYTLVMGTVILFSALIIFFNFVADIMYGVLDPRVRASR